MNDKIDPIEESLIKLEEEMAILRSFISKISQKFSQTKKEGLDLDINYQLALKLHDNYQQVIYTNFLDNNIDNSLENVNEPNFGSLIKNKNYLSILKNIADLEQKGSVILISKIDQVYYYYLKLIGEEGLSLFLSGSLQLDNLLIWEKRVESGGFGELNSEEKYVPSNKTISKVIKAFSTNILQKMDNKLIKPNKIEDHQNLIVENDSNPENDIESESLENLISMLYQQLENKKFLSLKEYFNNSSDIESIKNLFAIFSLIEDEKVDVNQNLGVELIESE